MASQYPTQRKRPVSPATLDAKKPCSGTCLRKRRTNSSCPSLHRSTHRPLSQPKLLDPAATSSPSRGLRDRVPQELTALLAQGSTGDTPKGVLVADDDASEDTSIAPEHRLSLLIAQALTLARIKLVCVTASTPTSFGYTNLKHTGTVLARLRQVNQDPPSPADSLEIPTVEELHALHSVSQKQDSACTLQSTDKKDKPDNALESDTTLSVAATMTVPLSRPLRHSQTPIPEDVLCCHFCGGRHYTYMCTQAVNLTERCVKAVTHGCCLRCLFIHVPRFC